MSTIGGPNVVDSGLVLELDAGNTKSYQSGSTTWYDKSGFAKNGTLINGVGYTSSFNGSLVFDGVDDYVTNPDLGSLSEFTVDCWFYPTSNPNNSAAIVTSAFTGGGKLNYVIGWGTQEVAPNTFFGGYYNAGWNKTPGIPSALNQWWNLTLSYSNNSLKFYSSGTLYSNTTYTTIPSSGNDGLRIGRRWDTAEYFVGRIPAVKIYNRALTADEVLQNYNALKSRFGL